MHARQQNQAVGQAEFVVIIAMMYATIAMSIDAMLPALPDIGAELTPQDLNRAQLILPSFLMGMGVGTLFSGPLSDAFGRRAVIAGGAVVFFASNLLAWWAPTLELMLVARFVSGLAAACPRVVGMAVVRDLYAGRDMARLISFVMMVFTFMPALAPLIGAQIIAVSGWRAIYLAFIGISVFSVLWYFLRQPETLPVDRRRPLRVPLLLAAFREVFSHRVVVLSVAVQTFVFSLLFMVLISTQPVFDIYFDQGENFPYWFGLIAVCGGVSTLINARYVQTFGMRFMVRIALTGQLVISAVMVFLFVSGALPRNLELVAYILWSITLFGMIGLTIGNLNALAMEPLGHIAGVAASLVGAVSTVLSLLIATPVGQAFDGTPVPMAISALLAVVAGRAIMAFMPDN